jgi:hypothetical protein
LIDELDDLLWNDPILLDFGCSPACRGGCIRVSENCNATTDDHALNFGLADACITERDDLKFLTGANQLTVKDIDVFEIID